MIFMDDDKIPVDKVLEDMYDPNGGPVSWAARDYYYATYATEEEKREMDREDRRMDIGALMFYITFILLFIRVIACYPL